MSHQYPGKLIAVEGLDGSGKSTQVYLLKRWLENQNMKVFFTEWNSSVIVKQATRKGKKRQLLTPTTFSLIHATDFADRYERQILPLIRGGYIVLADRYFFTALARDVTRGCEESWVRNLYEFAIKPDITFYFRVPLKTAFGRIFSRREKLKFFEAGMDMGMSTNINESFKLFQGKVFERYETLTQSESFTVIDAEKSIETQQSEIRDIVSQSLNLSDFKKHYID